MAPSPEFNDSLPQVAEVEQLFYRPNGEYRLSPKSTFLFTHFAQWFTDGFLRTDHSTNDESAFRRNTSNHDIDLCQLYGLTREQSDRLREGKGGRLKCSRMNDNDYPPLCFLPNGEPDPQFDSISVVLPLEYPNWEERKPWLFVGGVERVNVQLGYAMFNTLFLREHNRICGLLEKKYGWCDDRCFQTARNILIVILLRIVIEEYINHITPYHFKFFVDAKAFRNEIWYRNNWMTVEFNLLYRWHSMVPNTVFVGGRHRPLAETLFNNQLLVERGLPGTMQDASSQVAAQLGLMNTHSILVETAERPSIELGRKAQLASYNDYRELFGFPRATDFDQISGRKEVQEALKRVYGRVDRIELFTGLFAEDVRPNSALPGLIGRMVGVDAFSQALTNPLLSTNVFNRETFSDIGWEIIHETNTLTQLLHRNLGTATGSYKIKMTQSGDEVVTPVAVPEAAPTVMRRAGVQTPAASTESTFEGAMIEPAMEPESSERGLFVK